MEKYIYQNFRIKRIINILNVFQYKHTQTQKHTHTHTVVMNVLVQLSLTYRL